MPRRDVRLGWIPDTPDKRDLKYALFAPKVDIPNKVDLRDAYSVPVYDQGQLGSCTANAISGALQYLDGIEKVATPVSPSRLFIYYNERAAEGSVDYDSGAMIRDGIKSVVSQGVAPEGDWPYDISKFTLQPPASAYTDALKDRVTQYLSIDNDLTQMLTCLASGYPFVFGISVYGSFMNSKGGVIPMPSPGESLLGGHALCCVGYDQPNKVFIVRNSWGPGWGDRGHCTIPFDYLVSPDLGNDYWTVRLNTLVATQTKEVMQTAKGSTVVTKTPPKEAAPTS